MANEPPLQQTINSLLKETSELEISKVEDQIELPMIDLNCLKKGYKEREKCMREIVEAARKWGFFQVINHGISKEVSESMKYEQMKVFQEPFTMKIGKNFLNLPANSYRWGNSEATCLKQCFWSEALHISVADISRLDGHMTNLRSTMEAFARRATTIAETIAKILAENIGIKPNYFKQNCTPNTSFLRLNRYPPCPNLSSKVCGLVAHTDSDFLTILYQDTVGGLQLHKDDKWVCVKPNPEALIINVGDLFQALSSNIYTSVKHRVVAPQQVERFSVGYFYCPRNEAVIESCRSRPAVYRRFSFGEFREQVQRDLRATGAKVGLSRFLL
ncbi:gibberellin 2-beta-dioxygenase 8-like [Mercurialis annua]|uniref:gibberellin 2-beta-dioxygenase 8-like n=1 Tax=Mercurialis annua TaxID=3986 RepID=UPI00215EE134|nr:gibberellin 2-beta-dioxygenase 8-like [Mercurialis annua]